MQYTRLSEEDNDSLLLEQQQGGVPKTDIEDQPDGESTAAAAEVQAAALQALSAHEQLLADKAFQLLRECTLFKEVCAACDPKDDLVLELHASLCRGQVALHDQISLAQREGEVVDLLAINDVVEATLAVYQQRVEESLMMGDTRNETQEEQQQQEAAAATTTSLVVGVPLTPHEEEPPSVVESSFEDQLIDLLGEPSAAAAAAAATVPSTASKSDAQLDDEANNLLAEFDSLIGDIGANTGNSMQEAVAQPVTPPVVPALVKTSSEHEFEAFFADRTTTAAATSPNGPNMVASAV